MPDISIALSGMVSVVGGGVPMAMLMLVGSMVVVRQGGGIVYHVWSTTDMPDALPLWIVGIVVIGGHG